MPARPWQVGGRTLLFHDGSRLRVTRLESGGTTSHIAAPGGHRFECVELSPNGHLAVSKTSESWQIWQLPGGALLHSQPIDKEREFEGCSGALWQPAGAGLAIAGWRWRYGAKGSDVTGCSPEQSCGFSPNGRLFWRALSQGIELQVADSQKLVQRFDWGEQLMVDSSERYLAINGPAGDDFATELWSLGRIERLWRRENLAVTSFAPGGDFLRASWEGHDKEDVKGVFRTRDGKKVAGWTPPSSECSFGQVWSFDGSYHAAIDDERIHVVDVERRVARPFKVLEAETCGENLVTVSPTGRHFATKQRLFAFAPPRELGRFTADCATCEGAMIESPVDFNADGTFVAALIPGLPMKAGVFQVLPRFEPKPVAVLEGGPVWLAAGSLVAGIRYDSARTLELVRARDGAHFVIDPDRPNEGGLRDFAAADSP